MSRNSIDLKHYKPNSQKLLDYGFKHDQEIFVYQVLFKKHPFELQINVTQNDVITTSLVDLDSEAEYTLHLNDSTVGCFVGSIRQEYNDILSDIIVNCFDREVFQTAQAKQIIEYVKDQYAIDFEYLWAKSPNNAIARRNDNQKWFAVLLTVSKSKLGLEGDESIEVLNIKINPAQLNQMIDNTIFFPAYHMNKKHWLSIYLDQGVQNSKIMHWLNDSYELSANK